MLTERLPINHDLKVWPDYFQQVKSGEKNFELRFNDRDYKEGDILILMEFDFNKRKFTGQLEVRPVDYILYGTEETEKFGIKPGYCIMSWKSTPSPVSGTLEVIENEIKNWRSIQETASKISLYSTEKDVAERYKLLSSLYKQFVSSLNQIKESLKHNV